jgi:hypothetical protein
LITKEEARVYFAEWIPVFRASGVPDAGMAEMFAHWMMSHIEQIEAERAALKIGYRTLDANWSILHEAAMSALRGALKMPEGTVPEMVAAIDRLTRPFEDWRFMIIEGRARDATPGPWRWWDSNSFRRLSSDATGKDGDVLYGTVQQSDGHPDVMCSEADKAFIAHARTDVPWLLEEIRRLQAEIERLETATVTHETSLSKIERKSG